MLPSIRSGLLRGASAGLIAAGLLVVWLVAFPLITGNDANLEGLIVGSYGLAFPTSLAIAVPDDLHFVLAWLMLVALIPLNWALVGGVIVGAWTAIVRLRARRGND